MKEKNSTDFIAQECTRKLINYFCIVNASFEHVKRKLVTIFESEFLCMRKEKEIEKLSFYLYDYRFKIFSERSVYSLFLHNSKLKKRTLSELFVFPNSSLSKRTLFIRKYFISIVILSYSITK